MMSVKVGTEISRTLGKLEHHVADGLGLERDGMASIVFDTNQLD